MAEPLTIWAVSDGRAGIENQVLGLAEAVARLTAAQIVVKRIRYQPLFDRWPTALKLFPDAMLSAGSDAIVAPWPDIWIAAGRATLPHSLRMKARSGGRTLVVQLQDPTMPAGHFDLVIAPEHDEVTGGNVLSLIGSTHRLTPKRLREEAAAFTDMLAPLEHPLILAVIGGTSKTHDMGPERARALARDIRQAVTEAGGSLLLTFSRRTPKAARDMLRQTLSGLPGIIYDGEGPNPYFAFLAAADHILVTEDSVNMAVEAAATGTPIHILAMDRRRAPGKFARFHRSLTERGIARPFDGHLDSWTYAPLDETARAARYILDHVYATTP